LGARVEFAPYSQVLQELLNPSSLLSSNAGGLSVVLVRLEDWMTAGEQASPEDAAGPAPQGAATPGAAVAPRARPPPAVGVAPAARAALADPARAERLAALERRFVEFARGHAGVAVVPSAEMSSGLAADAIHDPAGLSLGHVPYTPAGFAALGTALARRIHAA